MDYHLSYSRFDNPLLHVTRMNEWVLIATCKQLVWSTRIGRNMPIWILWVSRRLYLRGHATMDSKSPDPVCFGAEETLEMVLVPITERFLRRSSAQNVPRSSSSSGQVLAGCIFSSGGRGGRKQNLKWIGQISSELYFPQPPSRPRQLFVRGPDSWRHPEGQLTSGLT
jgi:hypothetical protein